MRQVIVMPAARADMHEIARFISADNPIAAARVEARVYEAMDKLAFMPTARAGRIVGTFEKPVRGLPYIIAFELPDKETLRVLRIIHGARDWPAGGWPVQQPRLASCAIISNVPAPTARGAQAKCRQIGDARAQLPRFPNWKPHHP